MPARPGRPGLCSPLATWFPDPSGLAGLRRIGPGRRPLVLRPRDGGWRRLTPRFDQVVRLAEAGLPYQAVIGRRYDRRGDPRRLRPALAEGHTVFLPQAHQVLPRVARLMVALRNGLLGPRREECSFLFLVQGGGRPGMGLHHDGPVEAFWLQMEGYRTVTVGPPASPGPPADLDDRLAAQPRAGWVTLRLGPGTLFHLPPFTPHAVVCAGRSLALSLTWSTTPSSARGAAVAWDVVSGRSLAIPPAVRGRLFTQVPVTLDRLDRATRTAHTATPEGRLRLPAEAAVLVRRLDDMPTLTLPAGSPGPGMAALLRRGLVGPRDLPLAISPDDPAGLDGWRFR